MTLLTNEAVQAAWHAVHITPASEYDRPPTAVAAFLEFHATEGRAALEVAVARAIDIATARGDDLPHQMAEAVVTALLGEALGAERDRYREALADVIRVLDKYDNAPVTATNAIERARTVLAEDGGASA